VIRHWIGIIHLPAAIFASSIDLLTIAEAWPKVSTATCAAHDESASRARQLHHSIDRWENFRSIQPSWRLNLTAAPSSEAAAE
jgi:hypothetical protein